MRINFVVMATIYRATDTGMGQFSLDVRWVMKEKKSS
jgi:hypothetical protein